MAKMTLPLSPAIEQNDLEGQLIPKINVNGIADDCYTLSNPAKDLDEIMTSLLCVRGGEKSLFFLVCVCVCEAVDKSGILVVSFC